MSQDNIKTHDTTTTNATAYVTIIPETATTTNGVVPVPSVEFTGSNRNSDQTAVVLPIPICPPTGNADPNSNNNNSITNELLPSSPLNSDVLASRLENIQNNGGGGGSNENEGVPILQFRKGYPITRYSRKWKRPEVQGFCCLAIEIICLVTLAVLGLQAVGYFEAIKSNEHLPLSFSWKALWEFFGNSPLPKPTLECLYSSGGPGKIIIRDDESGYPGMEPVAPVDVNYVLMESLSSDSTEVTEKPRPKFHHRKRSRPIPTFNPDDENFCGFQQATYSLGWLAKFFMVANLMPVLNIVASSVLYSSISIRRRKGMQVLLLLPSFFCFFVSIFQQIPISFQYNYFDQALIKEMHTTLVHSNPPYFVVPILDETQAHHQCCGIEYPGNWELLGGYPQSCCNTTAFDCTKLDMISREHVWSAGCFQVEHDKIHHFERWALFLYALKVIAEVGIFCTLSDLTRFDYPPPEAQETSRCDFRNYQVRCRGVMHIKGLTKDGRIVINTKYFLPWRLIPSRTDMMNGITLYLKTDHSQIKGSVEVVKRYNVANFLNEDIQIDLSRKNRGIFVFTLI